MLFFFRFPASLAALFLPVESLFFKSPAQRKQRNRFNNLLDFHIFLLRTVTFAP